ncbi:MAG: gliding motility-associated C-terminal domain-containing protein [Dysgonamonadaceae bacterium]|jgi:gliding motility-associated-like protein|nr:gliding motility-associated C-terminal domain-containing protein [Dysgonamonadaceae bacterium]
MKKQILTILAGMCCLPLLAQYTVRGGLLAKNDVNNRIEVYLLNGLSNAEISFSGQGTHQWYKYNTRTSEAVAIPCLQSGNVSTITNISDGFGYFVGLNYPNPLPDDPNTTSYVWIIDYSLYASLLYRIETNEDANVCSYLHFSVDAENIAPLQYSTYNGGKAEIKKTFRLTYNDLAWNEDNKTFAPQVKEKITDDLTSLVVDAPLTNTSFTLIGDNFAEYFGTATTLTTDEYAAVALSVYSDTIQVKTEGETENTTEMSAPVEITFNAYANEPVAGMYIWTIKKKSGETLLRYTGKSVTYTFEESGDFTASLEVIGAGSVCDNEGESYDIHIGSSDLQLPNTFSPGSSFGSNDIYRVAYKSLINFKASIYNRWGNLMYHWEDPAQGWDGRVDGRFVPAGVYFIVVEATGADGKKYSQSSDINILRKK